jgi:four helix bundle protein
VSYKFEKLEVWQLALEYVDLIYEIAGQLPPQERFNLKSQMEQAATSVALNIAEGAMGQSDKEQVRFLGYAIRSVVETVACQHLIHRRGYLKDAKPLRRAYQMSETLCRKLFSMRNSLDPAKVRIGEDPAEYLSDEDQPF